MSKCTYPRSTRVPLYPHCQFPFQHHLQAFQFTAAKHSTNNSYTSHAQTSHQISITSIPYHAFHSLPYPPHSHDPSHSHNRRSQPPHPRTSLPGHLAKQSRKIPNPSRNRRDGAKHRFCRLKLHCRLWVLERLYA